MRTTFPKLMSLIALLFMSFMLISEAHAYQQNDAVVPDASYLYCHEAIPPAPNFALIGIIRADQCSNNIAYRVTLAKDGLRICNLNETVGGGAPFKMPFPADYVVTAIEHVANAQSKCGGSTTLYVIQHVAEGITACSGSYIPKGWSFVRSTPSLGSCELMEKNELHQATEGLRICTSSPYPTTFVIGSIEPVAACGMQEQYVLRTLSDGVKACVPTQIRAGYVITNIDHSERCGPFATLTLNMADDGIIVCPQSPIPKHYVIEATVPYTRCEYWPTGYRLKRVL